MLMNCLTLEEALWSDQIRGEHEQARMKSGEMSLCAACKMPGKDDMTNRDR
jgi:hypothetical protein